MSGEPPHGDDDDARPTIPQPEARLAYPREPVPGSGPPRRRPTLSGSASAPPTTTAGDRAVAYSAIPGPAPLPRVPGMDQLVGDDSAAGRGSAAARHRSRRSLRADDPPPAAAPSKPSQPPKPLQSEVSVAPDVVRVPATLSAPPPEVSDDDWGAPEVEAPPPRPSSPARAETPVAPSMPSSPASVAPADAAGPKSNPLARRAIPRPAPRPVSVAPADRAVAVLAEEPAGEVIRPVRIIDVLSDLPPVPPPPEALAALAALEGLEAAEPVELADDDEEAGLALRLLADGPTPIDARRYLEDVETAPPPPDDEAEEPREARGAFEEVEPEPIEEVEPEPRSEPDSIEELDPDRVSEPDRIPDSAEEIEPDRDSDSGDEIPVDIAEEPVAARPPPPPPPRRPPAVASLDLAAYAPPAEAAAPAPPQPPPLKAPSKPSAEHTPITDADAPRRKKPWWEEIFSEDFLRTMDRVDAKVIRRDVDFIEERLGMERGAVILDLACGAGQHAVEMASRGYSVVGYDLSLAMLARASDEAQERGQKLNFLQGDMREMAFEETFDAVYCWDTSFGYFDEEKNLDILVRVNRALRSGGLLLLDVINRDYVSCRQPSLVWFEGEGCVCMDEMQVDFFTSRLKVKRTVMFEDGRSRELDYSIRIYGLHELGKILHEAGFKVIEVSGHAAHPGVFFGSESPRLMILAERS